MDTSIIKTNRKQLVNYIKQGHFFVFCICFAINKGFRNSIKEKKEVKFSVGDYDVEFNQKEMCFTLSHKIYFARIICAYYDGVHFIGDSEKEVINELLTEFKKEL